MTLGNSKTCWMCFRLQHLKLYVTQQEETKAILFLMPASILAIFKACWPAFQFQIWQCSANSMQTYFTVKLQIFQKMWDYRQLIKGMLENYSRLLTDKGKLSRVRSAHDGERHSQRADRKLALEEKDWNSYAY